MNIQSYTENNLKCFISGSAVDSSFTKKMCWVGIDEAGRGPVLGPMVYGICYSPICCDGFLKETGFADSKTLTEEQRDSMFEKLNEKPDTIGWMVKILSPHYISTCMLRRTKYNLNELSHDTAIELLRNVVERGVNVKEVYIDTVGDPGKYQAKLKGIFPNLEITVAKKADATYPIVSAASICAKVARDKAVRDWKFSENIDYTDYGSGYPGDPKTKAFLNGHIDPVFGFPKFVRFSWSTASKLLEERAAVVRWADDEEEDKEKPKKRKPIASFFEPNAEKPHKAHRYFSERAITSCTSL